MAGGDGGGGAMGATSVLQLSLINIHTGFIDENHLVSAGMQWPIQPLSNFDPSPQLCWFDVFTFLTLGLLQVSVGHTYSMAHISLQQAKS